MDLFFSILIWGVVLIALGLIQIEVNKALKVKFSFNIKTTEKFISYFRSNTWAKINITYGVGLLFTSIIGIVFYENIGLLVALIMTVELNLYLLQSLIGAYKYSSNTN
ncbi:hypothetical protein [Romboutsia lituseburensis]|uniref:hypothetical protein n=1 Tax=Romboutsia lituseburensis TaxID=1537 RepID=UPI00215AF9E3|nr:hypothetical protein [Romboutsia lituseburensis]MCR8746996.1 hypothetical protein [Romboutsia lituseburensis]